MTVGWRTSRGASAFQWSRQCLSRNSRIHTRLDAVPRPPPVRRDPTLTGDATALRVMSAPPRQSRVRLSQHPCRFQERRLCCDCSDCLFAPTHCLGSCSECLVCCGCSDCFGQILFLQSQASRSPTPSGTVLHVVALFGSFRNMSHLDPSLSQKWSARAAGSDATVRLGQDQLRGC